MRKIKTKDVFKLARLIKISGTKEELTEILGASKSQDASEIGLKAIMTLITACGEEETEKGIYELLADIAEKKPTDIENMELEELSTFLKEISEQNNLSNFFDTAVKSA